VLAIAGLFVTEGTLRPVYCAGNSVRFCQEALSEDAVIDLTNTVRMGEGLSNLRQNPILNAVAEARAKDMAEKQYFGHVSPTGDRVALVAARNGYRYKLIAENLAAGFFSNNQKVIDAWLQSPGHRKNIMSPQVTEIGVSVVRGSMNGTDGWIVVQVFGVQTAQATYASYSSDSSGYRPALRNSDQDSTNINLRRVRMELDNEKESITRDMRILAGNSTKNQELNARITMYNRKADQYNRAVGETREEKAMNNMVVAEHRL
jgi:hypothetical protein